MAETSDPTPIRLRDLPGWIRRTRALDDEQYDAPPRPRTLRRVLASISPSLRRPVFVVGAPRSGTSFLGDAIGALPELSYHYEPPVTKAASRYVHERRWSEARARFFYRAVYRWLLRRHLDGDLRFAEKTPQNCFVMEFLARTFPGARFVHIVRDGRDAALSYVRKKWLTEAGRATGRREAGGYRIGPFARYWVEAARREEFESTTDFHRCIWAWRRHVEAALDATRALGGAVLEVRYEALVRDPTAAADAIVAFLEVCTPDSRERLLERLAAADDRSVGRWREELSPVDAACTEAEAGELLRRLGYLDATPRAAAADGAADGANR